MPETVSGESSANVPAFGNQEESHRVLLVAEGEEPCANSIRFNDLVVMPDGFPKTEELLRGQGYKVCKIGNTEAAKLDGGMSCLSLRFSPHR